MRNPICRIALTLLLAITANVAVADGPVAASHDTADHKVHLKQLEQASKLEFERVLAWYDDHARKNAFDVPAAVERCRFMSGFVGTFEYVDWLDDVYAMQEECSEQLRERYGDHPEVELYELESLYGEPLKQRVAALSERGERESWTNGQMARLHTRLAMALQATDAVGAKESALRALSFDLRANVRLIAARQLLVEGARDKARELLDFPLDTPDAADYWAASQKMEMLLQLGDIAAARRVYESLRKAGSSYDHVAASKLLRRMADIDAARAELEATDSEWTRALLARERFDLEFEFGTPAQALAAYERLRDVGYESDPLAINRMALMERDATLPWRPRDLLGLFGAGALIVIAALLLLVPIGCIHYRGLVVRTATGAPQPGADGWHLRHAWWVMVAFAAANLAALYFAGPFDVLSQNGKLWELPLQTGQWARMAVAGEILALLLAALVGQAAGRPPLPWHESWSIPKAVAMGAAVALAMRLPVFLSLLASGNFQANLLKNPVIQLVVLVRENYGVITSVWLLCIAAPVLEEFIFRGALLRAFQRHLTFAWANTLQAAMFALIHLDLRATPLLFVCGIAGGVLARRSGGLLAPIVMHAAFNGIICVVLLT